MGRTGGLWTKAGFAKEPREEEAKPWKTSARGVLEGMCSFRGPACSSWEVREQGMLKFGWGSEKAVFKSLSLKISS